MLLAITLLYNWKASEAVVITQKDDGNTFFNLKEDSHINKEVLFHFIIFCGLCIQLTTDTSTGMMLSLESSEDWEETN